MKKKRILALFLAAVSCLSLAVSASAANTVNRKATDFRDYDRTAWYAEAVSAAVDNGLLYGKSATVIDPNGDMTRAEMAAIINRSFGCYKAADISQYKDVAKSKWYYKDVAMAVQMGTYNGRSASSMAPDAPISRQEAMTVVARALELDYDSYSKTDLSVFSDRSEISNWAMPYVRAMVGADYIHGRGKVLAPLDNITRAEFAQIFYNIIGTYIVSKGTYDKDIKGSVLIRTDEVTLKDMTVDGDLIIGCGAADGKITLDNVTVKGRLLVWGGGTAAVYCNNGTNMPAVVVARVDDAVKVIYDRDSTLAVIDTIKVRITERAKQHKETEVIFYDVSDLREAQKQLNAIVADNQIDITAPAHLYQADKIHQGALPVPVRLMFDEFANVALPDGYARLQATMRSRNIMSTIILQNISQLKALFKDDWEGIIGNADSFVYLGGNEQSTHKYISELLGKETIDTRTSSQSKGRNGSFSQNFQQTGRELMTPDEVRRLDNKNAIVLIRGEKPVIDEKYDILKHPNIHRTEDGSAPPYLHTPLRAFAADDLSFPIENIDDIEFLED